jgi:MGT family glycosyltransferase
VHVPFYSHVGAATRLAGVLSRQGHEVIAWGPEPSREQIEAAGARFRFHQPAMPTVGGFGAFAAELASTTERFTEELIDELHREEVDLVIHDSQVPWARVAGDYLGLPRIVSHPMFPIVSPERISSDDDVHLIHPDPVEAQRNFEQSWLSVARRWGVEMGNWSTVVHSTGENTFTYTTDEILGDYELQPGWHFVGPLMDPIPRAAEQPARPLVYVCFGTSFNTRQELFQAVIDGLADEDVDVLISTGKGPVTEAVLGELPPNVELRDFVQTRDVLGRASVHITHGGNNSVHETLLAGVPMLFLPQAFDQFPLAGSIAKLGAGRVAVETAASVRDGVRWLLYDALPRGRARDLGENLASFDGEQAVADAIAHVLDEASAVRA